MKRVLGGLLLSALLLVASPCSSYAETCGCAGHSNGPMMRGMRHGKMGMARHGHRMWMRLRRLGLNEKQREEIRGIWSAAMKDAVLKKANVRIARIELKDLLVKDPVDMQAVGAKLKEIASLQTDLRFARIKAMEDVRAQLTPEQRKKLREDFEKYRGPQFRRWGGGRIGAAATEGPHGKRRPDMDQMD